MTDLLVYAVESRADSARALLAAACAATGASVQLDRYATGSLYQRLGSRRAPPPPDLTWWFGPFAAAAAASDGLLQAYQPAHVADGAVHDAGWNWTTLEYSTIGVVGAPLATWPDLTGVPKLAMADPERSEVGMALLLASLDQARQGQGGLEAGWAWWTERAAAGLTLCEDDASAVALVQSGAASHALTLAADTPPLLGLAPLPHGLGIAATSRNLDAARALMDWLTSEQAGATLKLSPWQTATNGLGPVLQAAPQLDVVWATQEYTNTRQRWAQSGFGPR